ncbi:RNA polymerase subunit sigma-70 [Streptomyces rimosus]|uniref:RNA polymerase subunit sigma-70 n=1 Tax=Streptomyces rimosus TaxID=1927 RepID=UPI00067C5323|nr:RNA polymerase subunit sigma-70 [Streptomyces rimosus]
MSGGKVVGGPGDDDAAAFSRLVARYRPELQVHCYRLLGSFEESGRLVTETLLRAWRERESFAGHATFRTWLYRVATHACLDFLAATPRTPLPREVRVGGPVPATELPWLQPCPDTLLEQVPAQKTGSDEVVARETISLAFVVALQLLPPRQRAVFVLREVLGWPARETAAALGASVAAVNSALQRARPAVRKRLPRPGEPAAPERDDCAVLRLYTDALERGDADALATVVREDARAARRPDPPDCRRLPTRMNHQPAVARYARGPGGHVYRAHGLEVLRVEDGRVAGITVFAPGLFPAMGLPLAL